MKAKKLNHNEALDLAHTLNISNLHEKIIEFLSLVTNGFISIDNEPKTTISIIIEEMIDEDFTF